MKKLVLIFAMFAFLAVSLQAQVLYPDGIYQKQHTIERKPVPYNHLREADMMWTKRVYRVIDMRQKINLPLYYPIAMEKMGDRYSFINLMLKAWKDGAGEKDYTTGEKDPPPLLLTLMAAQGDNDHFPSMLPASPTEVIVKISDSAIDTSLSTSASGGNNAAAIDWPAVWDATYQVKKLLIKEDWYFDKQRSEMKVRIVGICPIIDQITYDMNTGEETGTRAKQLFWIYFREARTWLANHEVFNPNNDAERKTFDDIFFKRRFDSYVERESNVYNNRVIVSYKTALDALLESERIKNWIFLTEHDLWEY